MIFTLVIQVIPVCLALAGVLVWCSLHVKPPFSRVLRPIFTWISIILSLGSPLLFVVLAGLYWSSMVELFRMHPVVSVIMVTVSMSAWISLAVFLVAPEHGDLAASHVHQEQEDHDTAGVEYLHGWEHERFQRACWWYGTGVYDTV